MYIVIYYVVAKVYSLKKSFLLCFQSGTGNFFSELTQEVAQIWQKVITTGHLMRMEFSTNKQQICIAKRAL